MSDDAALFGLGSKSWVCKLSDNTRCLGLDGSDLCGGDWIVVGTDAIRTSWVVLWDFSIDSDLCCFDLTTSHVVWTDHDDEDYHSVVEEMSEYGKPICKEVNETVDSKWWIHGHVCHLQVLMPWMYLRPRLEVTDWMLNVDQSVNWWATTWSHYKMCHCLERLHLKLQQLLILSLLQLLTFQHLSQKVLLLIDPVHQLTITSLFPVKPFVEYLEKYKPKLNWHATIHKVKLMKSMIQ